MLDISLNFRHIKQIRPFRVQRYCTSLLLILYEDEGLLIYNLYVKSFCILSLLSMDYNVRTHQCVHLCGCVFARACFLNIHLKTLTIFWLWETLFTGRTKVFHVVLRSDDKALIYITSVRIDVHTTIVVTMNVNPNRWNYKPKW